MPQFAKSPTTDNDRDDLALGLTLFCVGLFKKVVIADALAVHAQTGFDPLAGGHTPDFVTAWTTVLAYSFQLYFDFSGYSDMAVGLARLFGIRFPANFYSPYKSTGIIEFWRRWHISLSRFLRDYLYIPLGGNRQGRFRRYFSLGTVMLLGGLWHGANWTFVVWGALHGVLLTINHAWRLTRVSDSRFMRSPLGGFLCVFLTFLVVTLAWVPFRAENVGDAGRMLVALFPFGQNGPSPWDSLHPFVRHRTAIYHLLGAAIITFAVPNTYQVFARFDPVLNFSIAQLQHRMSLTCLDWKLALFLSLMFVYSILLLSKVSPFLYFQF